ncbi:MAG: hypothetical protein M3457_07595 [Chloroflexota bacterium]|nr:hypothetical protein [Chloroflexota bacterium]
MTLGATFADLEQAAARLDQVFGNFLWAVVQAKPESGSGPAVVDHWEAAAQDTAGLAREICEAAREGRLAANGRFDPALAQRALVGCQANFDPLWLRYCADLLAFERRQALADVLRQGGTWGRWTEGVIDALDQCLPALYDLNLALTRCWEELVDRKGLISVSVQATATGQDIRVGRKGTPRNKRRTVVANDSDAGTDGGS